jgi:hypothetical protein
LSDDQTRAVAPFIFVEDALSGLQRLGAAQRLTEPLLHAWRLKVKAGTA